MKFEETLQRLNDISNLKKKEKEFLLLFCLYNFTCKKHGDNYLIKAKACEVEYNRIQKTIDESYKK